MSDPDPRFSPTPESLAWLAAMGEADLAAEEHLEREGKSLLTGAICPHCKLHRGHRANCPAEQDGLATGDYSLRNWIQAIHRIFRFLQTKRVKIYLIFAESERPILETLLEKWERHKAQLQKMSEIIAEYGLSRIAMAESLTRSLIPERQEKTGGRFLAINHDCVEALHVMNSDSIGLILTSPPFSHMYEYSSSYADFGHSDGNSHFWEQMDFLIPQMFRVLQPGRIAAIHVKDRVVPSGLTGLGFQVIYPFHSD